jgi:hypothetical protein
VTKAVVLEGPAARPACKRIKYRVYNKRLKDDLEKLEAEIDVLETKDIELKPMKCA